MGIMMDKLEEALEEAKKLPEARLTTLASRLATFATRLSDIATDKGINGGASSALMNGSHHPPTKTFDVDEAHLEKHRILAHHPRTAEADIFRILRTRILQIMSESGFRTLAITSPNYGDGKTTIALNLAVSIALDLKQTVLLADLDLRKPNLCDYLGIDSRIGLSNYLLHDTPLHECLVRPSFDRLNTLPAGPALDYSSEILGSPKMTALARELKTRYADRMIIYDMPPVLAQDDSIAFLPQVDAVLMVVRDGVSRGYEIKRCLDSLSNANVIGTVLNDARDPNTDRRRPPRKE
jgi:Mrp family chromosome partitioning ATPase